MPRFVGYIKNDRYAVGCTGQTVYLYDAAGQELARFRDIKYGYTPKFSPDGDTLVVKSTAGWFAVYSLSRLCLVKKFRFCKLYGQDGSFCFSEDGNRLYNIEVYPDPERKYMVILGIGIYDTTDYSLADGFCRKNWSPIALERIAGSIYVLGHYDRKGLRQHFVARLKDGDLSDIRFVPEAECDFHHALIHSQMHGFTPESNQWSLLKYQGHEPMDYAGKDISLADLWNNEEKPKC